MIDDGRGKLSGVGASGGLESVPDDSAPEESETGREDVGELSFADEDEGFAARTVSAESGTASGASGGAMSPGTSGTGSNVSARASIVRILPNSSGWRVSLSSDIR